MPVVEITDRARVGALLADEPTLMLEAADENTVDVGEGMVSIFAEDEPRPVNMLVVRWSQAALGLRSAAHLRGGRLTGLEDVVRAVPPDRGQFEATAPFWAAPAFGAVFETEVLGAQAIYVLDKERLRPSAVVRQCMRLTDHEVVKPMFRKLAADTPIYVLSLRDALTSVAVVTHLHQGRARLAAYTVEEARGRGFGRGVLTALAEELLAMRVVPTAAIELGHEPSVRMIESAGFHQHAAHFRLKLGARRMATTAPAGLVQLGQK